MKADQVLATALALSAALGFSSVAGAATVASEDFDGGAVNLTSSSVPTLDGGAGDSFAVGHTAAWPTTGGTPFSLVDNTVGNVGDSTFFATDNEGIYGVNSDFQNDFLGISDTREWTTAQTTASWTFDISSGGALPLTLSIDMGSMEGSSLLYDAATSLAFTYSIDAGPSQPAMTVTRSPALPVAYSYRALDNGVVQTELQPLVASGTGLVKQPADNAFPALDTFLDKSPGSGPAAGRLDTFTVPLVGTGNSLVLTLVASVAFEAAAVDNLTIESVPEPVGLGVLAVGAATLLGRRRRV